tara:strand:- start:965 stop:1252 length:288 start_codon:yes stop_codon:yes gene_type:complete
MPSRKRRKRHEKEEPRESIFTLLAEGLAAGIVQTFTAEAQKVAEGFVAARQGNALEKKDEEPKTSEIVVESEPTAVPVEVPKDEDVIEGEFRYVD